MSCKRTHASGSARWRQSRCRGRLPQLPSRKTNKALGQHAAAAADLRAAIAEIGDRLNPARPDVTLLVDRGWAFAMLGDRKSAEADLAAARARHADPWSLQRLESRIAGTDEAHEQATGP